MTTVLNIRIDPRLKKAMERIAQEQSITLSDAIRIAMVKYLKEQGIDWREEAEE
jgi:antitoxin component of RelBE/YafQ-DinJ toxin-antitoxin module